MCSLFFERSPVWRGGKPPSGLPPPSNSSNSPAARRIDINCKRPTRCASIWRPGERNGLRDGGPRPRPRPRPRAAWACACRRDGRHYIVLAPRANRFRGRGESWREAAKAGVRMDTGLRPAPVREWLAFALCGPRLSPTPASWRLAQRPTRLRHGRTLE